MRRFLQVLALTALPALPALVMANPAHAQTLAPGSRPAFGGGTLAGAPVTLNGTAGGPVDLSRVGGTGSCRGYGTPQPSHTLQFSGGPVRLTTSARSDATLVVRLPDGRLLCDDDGGDGNSPLIETATSAGVIEVWVGSYGGSVFPYTLMASGAGAPAVAPPPASGGSMFGNLAIGPGMPDPAIVRGTFGGPVAASDISSGCPGYVSGTPSHIVSVSSYMSSLRFVVNGDADTTLLVQFPDGSFVCNDDGGGYPHPLVASATGPGAIRVWVGAYSGPTTTGRYTLVVTTNPSITATNMTGGSVAPPPVVVAPPPSLPPVTGAVRVDLDPRIPVTLYGAGVSPTVAVWSPRGGPSIEVSSTPRGSMVTIAVSVNGVVQSVVDVPAAMASGAIVTVTERSDRRLLVRAERAPSGSDAGETMLWLLNYAASSGAVAIAESWAGSASERGPRWSR